MMSKSHLPLSIRIDLKSPDLRTRVRMAVLDWTFFSISLAILTHVLCLMNKFECRILVTSENETSMTCQMIHLAILTLALRLVSKLNRHGTYNTFYGI
jgi:hypothetical protein